MKYPIRKPHRSFPHSIVPAVGRSVSQGVSDLVTLPPRRPPFCSVSYLVCRDDGIDGSILGWLRYSTMRCAWILDLDTGTVGVGSYVEDRTATRSGWIGIGDADLLGLFFFSTRFNETDLIDSPPSD